ERYSGGGYLIIQQLIEDISGSTFAAFVQKQIFDPLQMEHTTYSHYPDAELRMDIARGHEDNGKVDPKRKYNLYPEMAAAGPWTTPSDLARLIIAIHQASRGENKVLAGPKLIAQMLTPQLNAMGLGLNLKGADQVLGYWHAGNNAGYTGMLFAITGTGQGAVVLTNSNAGEYLALEAVRSIANAYNWPVMKTINEQPLENINAYLGLYKVGEKDALVFTQQKNQLYFNKAGSKTSYRLYKAEDGSFRMIEKPDNLSFTFNVDTAGIITGATMYENAGSVNIMTKSVY
ncbi:MAG: class A beta-lactamase-related serine hydrolase, partial [Chitinophagaceae bacterium]